MVTCKAGVEEDNHFVWQHVEGTGAEVNLTLRPDLWGGGEEYNP